MKNAITEKSLKILNYLKENDGVNMTASDIAEALGMTEKSVGGTVTGGLVRNRGLAERVPAEIQLEDNTHKMVNFIKATPAGLAYDHEAALAADAASAE